MTTVWSQAILMMVDTLDQLSLLVSDSSSPGAGRNLSSLVSALRGEVDEKKEDSKDKMLRASVEAMARRISMLERELQEKR